MAEDKQSIIGSIPNGRFGTPEEVADAVAFLVNNDYANNCVLNLDGGLSASSIARRSRGG
jgi:NAD(P)-dependent dehydrogenase (short-subunit alcohol dehydrogenase family)